MKKGAKRDHKAFLRSLFDILLLVLLNSNPVVVLCPLGVRNTAIHVLLNDSSITRIVCYNHTLITVSQRNELTSGCLVSGKFECHGIVSISEFPTMTRLFLTICVKVGVLRKYEVEVREAALTDCAGFGNLNLHVRPLEGA